MILTFFLLSLLVLFLDQWTGGWSTMHLFCVYRSSLKDPLFYIRLLGHVLGHASWDHFLNNMLLLLVIGPPMEEKYGSLPLRGIGFAQDVGGAIKQRRIDLFCGGSERANYVASHLDAPGPAWVLVAR